jgi:hypothetical protein
MQRLRPLSEEECYLRCHGQRGADDTVKVIGPVTRGERPAQSMFAQRVQAQFEAALDARKPEAA